jgi:predicted ABC-type ATPase
VNRPRVTVIAGANGSGKTTLTRWDVENFRETPLLDPDAISKTGRNQLLPEHRL